MLSRPGRASERRILVAVGAAAGVVFAAAPTGVAPVDRVWSGLLVGLLAYAGAYASSLALLPAAAAAAVLTGTGPGLVLAAGSVVVAGLAAGQERPSSRVTVVSGALLGLSLLHGGSGDHALAWIVGAVLVAAVLASAWQGSSKRRRRIALQIAAPAALLVVLLAAAGGLAGLRAEAHADDAIDALRAARASATSGDLDTSVLQFREAESDFRAASDALGSYGRLGRAVPGMSQQLGAAKVAVDTGADASGALRGVAGSIHLDDVSLQAGSVDLAAITKAEQPLSVAVDAVARAVRRLSSVDRGPLIGPVRDAFDDARDEAVAAGRSVDRAHRATLVLPGLLGGANPTRYLVLFTSPVEARNRFGFAGAYAVVRFESGHMSIERSGPTDDLVEAAGVIDQSKLQVPARALPYSSYGVSRTWRSITLPGDGPSVGELAVQMGALSGLGRLDGVVMADPQAVAAIVGLTGPVPVPGLDVTLTADNTADFLERRQYLEFPTVSEVTARKDKLVEVADLVGARLGQISTGSIRQLADRFGPLIQQGHLVIDLPTTADPTAVSLLHDLGIDGALDAPEHADLLYVGQRNRVGNKIDLFLTRQLAYDVDVDEHGTLAADLTVDLTNTAPASGLPDYVIGSAQPQPPPKGTNLTTTLIYSPHELSSLTVDGQPVTPPVLVDGELLVYQVELELAPGQHRRIEAHLSGVAEGDSYALRYLPGTLVHPDRLTVHLSDRRHGGQAVRRDLAVVTGPACLGVELAPDCSS